MVDDASGDRSAERVRAIAAQDPRVRLVVHPHNRGVGAARNTILEHARGEFIAFFDDDDVSSPDRLRRQWERIHDYERATGAELVLCHTARSMRLPGPHARATLEPALGADITPAPSGEAVIELILLGRPVAAGGSAATCSQMARHRVYAAVGGYDGGLRRSEDTDFNLRAAAAGAHFPGVDEALVSQNVTPTHDKASAAEHDNFLRLLDKHRRLLEERNAYRFTRRWVAMKFALRQRRLAAACGHALVLSGTRPIATLRRIAWSLPNWRRQRALVRALGAAE